MNNLVHLSLIITTLFKCRVTTIFIKDIPCINNEVQLLQLIFTLHSDSLTPELMLIYTMLQPLYGYVDFKVSYGLFVLQHGQLLSYGLVVDAFHLSH